jgi:hypothetical protein
LRRVSTRCSSRREPAAAKLQSASPSALPPRHTSATNLFAPPGRALQPCRFTRRRAY